MKSNTSLGKCKVILIFGRFVSWLSTANVWVGFLAIPPRLHAICFAHYVYCSVIYFLNVDDDDDDHDCTHATLHCVDFEIRVSVCECAGFFFVISVSCAHCVDEWSSKNKRAITFCRHCDRYSMDDEQHCPCQAIIRIKQKNFRFSRHSTTLTALPHIHIIFTKN